MTIKEIAAIAGVSPATISRVVNGKNEKAASPETRERIWEIVHKTGYTPNESAQALRLKPPCNQESSKKILCIFARTVDSYLDPFFTELMHSIEQELFSNGFTMRTLLSTDELRSSITFSDVCGVIILGRIMPDAMQVLSARISNIVYVGLNHLPYNIDQVVSSAYQAARTAVEYLRKLGHTQIVYIGETGDEQRYRGYLDAMGSASPNCKAIVAATHFTPMGGYAAINWLITQSKEFSALFCGNDDTAIGAVKALKEHGIRVPYDVSVIGVGDIELSQFFSPMLSTVHIPIRELGCQASKTLIDRIKGGHQLPMRIELPNSVAIRESCLPPKKSSRKNTRQST